jgi:hypothetical protein
VRHRLWRIVGSDLESQLFSRCGTALAVANSYRRGVRA